MNTIGIRKEDENKRFERRAPLTPAHIRELKREFPQARFIIQPGHGTRYARAFADEEYHAAGAEIGAMADADIILGIKEVPVSDLLPGKVYVFFSHTYKGQPYNMPMLRKLLALGCTVMDYELIVEDVDDTAYALDQHRRRVYFGHFAGYAGAINTLHALGQRLEYEGILSPFAAVKQAIDYHAVPGAQYGDFETALRSVRRVGEHIREDGLPDELHPLIFGVTGGGNVARAARFVLEHLPVIEISPEQLVSFAPPPDEARRHVYLVQFRRKHRRPDVFPQYIQRLTALINGIKWKSHHERLVTRALLCDLWRDGQPRLRVIGDVSCDPNGSIEISRPTYPDAPHYLYNPARDDLSRPWDRAQFERTCHDGVDGDGVVVMAVTNLPAELPRDASAAFGDMLRDFIPALMQADFSLPLAQLNLPRQLKRAVIAHQGQLAPDFVHLAGAVAPRVLLLGAGLMSPGVIDYLVKQGYTVRVADADAAQAQRRIAGYPAGQVGAVHLPVDAAHREALITELQQADVAISLLPAPLHHEVAALCIETRTHLVTASYTSPEMWALDDAARAVGVILLNEAGLDPGLDHMSAMQVIDAVRAQGGTVTGFTSYCGGLPHSDAADNPLRFKASWSPAGIVGAANRPARFRQAGENYTLAPRDLFTAPQVFRFDDVAYLLEAYPNGDSMAYIEAYGLQAALTFVRGTLRYAGWCKVIVALHDLGWFSDEPAAAVIERTVQAAAGNVGLARVVNWLGLTQAAADDQAAQAHLLACFIAQDDLRYAPGERDLVVMRHSFDVVYADARREHITSSLVVAGQENGLSAMAATVGLTAAICARLILEGRYARPGVQRPLTPDIYTPVLDEMAAMGFGFTESVQRGD